MVLQFPRSQSIGTYNVNVVNQIIDRRLVDEEYYQMNRCWHAIVKHLYCSMERVLNKSDLGLDKDSLELQR